MGDIGPWALNAGLPALLPEVRGALGLLRGTCRGGCGPVGTEVPPGNKGIAFVSYTDAATAQAVVAEQQHEVKWGPFLVLRSCL